MVSFSNYSYEPSLGSRLAAGKPLIENADVAQVLLAKLLQMRTDIAWLQEETKAKNLGVGEVIHSDFFQANDQVKSGSVNLMITSPPYMNNYHYVRNTRPQLYWLSFIASPSEQKYLETQNFGPYWQNVREAEPVALRFEFRGLEKILRRLRETRRIEALMEDLAGRIMLHPTSTTVFVLCLSLDDYSPLVGWELWSSGTLSYKDWTFARRKSWER